VHREGDRLKEQVHGSGFIAVVILLDFASKSCFSFCHRYSWTRRPTPNKFYVCLRPDVNPLGLFLIFRWEGMNNSIGGRKRRSQPDYSFPRTLCLSNWYTIFNG
jgi:hypothetical protein